MLGAVLTLIGCELAGELLRTAAHLPVPGPVIGMILLVVALAWRGRPVVEDDPMDRTAGVLLSHMGLLFVPAGVGIIAEAGVLRQAWMPILAGLVGSTVLSLMVTGFVMHRLGRGAAS